MSRTFGIFILLLFYAPSILAQTCTCETQFSFAKAYYERNSPAFQKIISDRSALHAYDSAARKLLTAAKREKDGERCIIYLDKYVALLKDHHSGIGFKLSRVDLGSPEKIEAFKATRKFANFRRIAIDSARLWQELQAKPFSDIEGIYSDGRTTFVGIKATGVAGRYEGVVLKSNKLLDPGLLLFELDEQPDHSFDITYFIGLIGFTVDKIVKNQSVKQGQIESFGFAKIAKDDAGQAAYSFRALDDSTNYLRLSSFDYTLVKDLDSFYTTIEEDLRARPGLIIDLRGNGGGSEMGYRNLLQYAYTDPLQLDSGSVWVTPDNIRRLEEFAEAGGSVDSMLIARMRKARPDTFIPLSDDPRDTWALDSVLPYPRNIVVLTDRGTASAAEGFVLYLSQSKKVKLVGDNTGGYIGYGNVLSAPMPCGSYTVQNTIIKYYEKSKYEFTGIPPTYRPGAQQDWIKYAQQLLRTTASR